MDWRFRFSKSDLSDTVYLHQSGANPFAGGRFVMNMPVESRRGEVFVNRRVRHRWLYAPHG